MNCKRAQQLGLSGPDEPVPAAARGALQAHLAACPACRRERDRAARIDQALVQWVAAAPIGSAATTRRRVAAQRTRRQVQLRRVVAAGGRAVGGLALRGAALVMLLLMLLGLGAGFGLPQTRTLVQAGLHPFGAGDATLPVLPIAGDQVWVEAITPSSDTWLSSAPTFELQLGYTLVSAPEGLISVRLAARPESQMRYFARPVRVDRGTNRTVVRFTVDGPRARQLLGAGEVQIEVLMRGVAPNGTTPLLRRTTFGRWQLT